MTNNILIISPVPTHPCIAGNRARIINLGSALRNHGHNVYFIHIGFETGDESSMVNFWGKNNYFFIPYTKPNQKIRRRLKKIKSLFDRKALYKYSIDEWYDSSVDLSLKSICSGLKFDTVFIEYVFFSKCLLNFGPDIKKFLDTHDVFSDRHEKFLAQGKKPIWFSTTKNEESKALNRADYVIAIQKMERDFFSTITKSPVITTGHPVFVTMPSSPSRSNTLLFMGSENMNNIDAINTFLETIFPKILKEKPDTEVLLVGTICNRVKDQKNVTKLGKVDDLTEVYHSATIVINPIQFGTGLKIKNIEALGYAKPLITTRIGAAGMEAGINKAFIMAEDADTFALKTLSLLSDPNQRSALSYQAHLFAKDWNNTVLDELNSYL